MTGQEVCVTGIGLVTPAGDGREACWERICKGLPTSVLEQQGDERRLVCRVPPFDPARLGRARARKPDRYAQLALLAAREAIVDAGLEPELRDGARVAVVVGTAGGGAGTFEAEHGLLLDRGPDFVSPFAVPSSLANSVAAQLAIEFRASGPGFTVNTACASGATAVGAARDLLLLDRCDIALVGGAEAATTPYYFAGFGQLGALSSRFHDPTGALRPFDADRDGFVMGEGAGMLVLERPADVRARRARVRARIVGYGASCDAHHVVSPHPDGAGITAAVRAALADAGRAAADVGHVNAHGTGTGRGDAVEAAALASALPHRPPVTSTKGVTGHLLGAAGAVEAALTALTLERGLLPPTANLERLGPGIDLDVVTECRPAAPALALSVSVGFGGHNAVLAIAAP